jgi:hypothetical protein
MRIPTNPRDPQGDARNETSRGKMPLVSRVKPKDQRDTKTAPTIPMKGSIQMRSKYFAVSSANRAKAT